MTKQLEAKFYAAGVIDTDGCCERVSDDEAQFWTVYERQRDGTSQAICDCDSRSGADAAADRFNALIAALEQAQQSEEVAELLRDKVKRLESDIWDSQQLVKVKSENQYELECKVRELEERNDKSNTAWSRREDAALEKLEAAEKRIAELKASPLAVKLPDLEKWLKSDAMCAYRALVIEAIRAAGGTVSEGE